MPEYGFLLTRILPDIDRICDSVFIREKMGQWKPVFSHILCSGVSYSSGLLEVLKPGQALEILLQYSSVTFLNQKLCFFLHQNYKTRNS